MAAQAREPPYLGKTVNFALLDGVIVVAYLGLVVVLGILVNRYISGLTDYLVAGRAAGTALSVATLVGTELGLVTLMYAAIEGFQHGFAALSIAVIAFAAALLVGSTGFVIRRLRQLQLLTVPEFYEHRFGRRVRVFGGLICALAGILNMGLFPKMGAIFLTHATGLASEGDTEGTVNLVMTGLIALVVLYTVAGGMVAVILTDFLQFVVLSIGLAIGLYFCFTHEALSFKTVAETLHKYQGEAAFNPVAEGSYGWVFLIWMALISTAAMICWAPGTSRALSADSDRAACRAFSWSSLGYFSRFAMPYLFGMAAFTWFANASDGSPFFFPEGPGAPPENSVAAMPMLISRVLPSGALGLLVAGLMAAFMSTHDSYFLSWGSILAQDVIAPLRGQQLTPQQRMRVTRMAVVGISLFLLVWGVWYPLPDSVWSYMAVTGTIYMSGAAAVLVAGLYWSRASSKGAGCALAAGLFGLLALLPEEARPGWCTAPVVAVLAFVLSAGAMVLGSLLFPDAETQEAPK
jgi:SSS family solute:Na+ symporter